MFNHYLITALRGLRSSPFISTVHIVGLSLGLACFIGAYATVRYIESSDTQFATADRAYTITQRIHSPQGDFDTGAGARTAPVVARHLVQELPELEAIARVETLLELDVRVGDRKTKLAGAVADADFFSIFPFKMQRGSASDPLREPRSVVLTADTAIRLFGTRDVIGKTVTLKKAIDLSITGVIANVPAPSQFDKTPLSSIPFDVLASMDVLDEIVVAEGGQRPSQMPTASQWGVLNGSTYVLLPHSGAVTLDRLKSALARFPEKYVPQARRASGTFEFNAVPASEVWKSNVNSALFHGSTLSVTDLLQILGGLILAIACLNYANLATAGIAAKLRETGMRRALGASGRQVVAQCLVEVAILATIALAFALVLLLAATPFLKNATGVDLVTAVVSNAFVWLYVAGAIVATCLLAGLYPAIVMSRVRPANVMRQSLRGQTTLASRLLVGAQFWAASFLLIAVIVVVAQSHELHDKGLGKNAAQTLFLAKRLAAAGVKFEVLQAELLRIAGVESVAAIDNLPWGISSNTGTISRSLETADTFVSPFIHTITPGFETTMGIALIAGRSFDAVHGEDFFEQRFPAGLRTLDASRIYGVIVDSKLAGELGYQDPRTAVDQIVYLPYARIGAKNVTARIIGVVEERPLRLISSGTTTNMYIAAREVSGYPIVRIRSLDMPTTLAAIDAVWSRLVPDMVLERRFVDEQFERGYETYARISRIITGVTIFAFAISIMGLFGMAIFIAERRRREIGVRKTLGATVNQILFLLLRDFSKPVVIANLAIWPLGYVAANIYLSAFMQRIAITPLPFIASLMLTVFIAWLAVGGQAWRAARMSPATVLRRD